MDGWVGGLSEGAGALDGAGLDANVAGGEFRRRLTSGGLHGALALLNARTRHRFTGVYRLDPPMLRNVCLYDRENPGLRLGGDSPMRETYCSLVAADECPLTLDDAPADPRAAGHPARYSVLAYCGVPIRGAGGHVLGTLCHFDVRPRLGAACDVALLETAARLLAPYLTAAAAPEPAPH